jgi:UDP:flavonoid glycosyltransferase YjiC (YdhE family)
MKTGRSYVMRASVLAAMLQELGAGIALDGEAEPAAIRTAVEAVMGQPSYLAAARRLAGAIASAPGASGAADELERVASTRPLNRVLEES